MAWGSFLQGEKGEEAPKTHLVWRERWRAQNCRGNPETQKKSRNCWKAMKVSWCCPTWLDVQCTAAARLCLRCSWKGTQGWSIPEGEARVDVETKTSDTPWASTGYCFFQNNCPRAAESLSRRTPRESPHTCTGCEQEPWEVNSKDSQALPSLCQEGSGRDATEQGRSQQTWPGHAFPAVLLVGMARIQGKEHHSVQLNSHSSCWVGLWGCLRDQ